MLAQDGIRSVLASGPRLWDLATGSSTSPFLDGFLPPLYLGALRTDTAIALVRQRHLAEDARPALTEDDVEAICRWGGGHPFLLQLLSKRVVELGDVEAAVAAVAGDRSVTSLFEIDLELLDDEQRATLGMIGGGDGASLDERNQKMLELRRLGLVEVDDGGRPRVALPLLRDWLG